MNNVITRSISGIVYIAIIIGAILGGGIWFYALTLALCIMAMFEYQHLCESKSGVIMPAPMRAFDIIGAILVWSIIPISSIPLLSSMNMNSFDNLVASSLIGIIIATAIISIVFLFAVGRLFFTVFDRTETPWDNTGKSLLGIIYIALPLSLLNVFVLPGVSYIYVLMSFILIWINDTGAFCVGSTMGKRKLCERLSPKKSWEGFYGGLVLCMLTGAIFAWVSERPVLEWTFFGAIVSVMSTIGDLFESLLKRNAGVKDSGNIIPGHGGILDRIDSLLFVAPVAFVYWLFIAMVK